MAKEYDVTESLSRTWPGIELIAVDGRIGQVTWSGGTKAATTKASANFQHNPYLPDIDTMRRTEQRKKDEEQAKKDEGGKGAV